MPQKTMPRMGGGLIVLDVFVHCLQSAKAKARVQGGRRSEATQESQIMSGDVALSHSQPRPVRDVASQISPSSRSSATSEVSCQQHAPRAGHRTKPYQLTNRSPTMTTPVRGLGSCVVATLFGWGDPAPMMAAL